MENVKTIIGAFVWGVISIIAFIWGAPDKRWLAAIGIFIFILLPVGLYLSLLVLEGVALQLAWAKSSNGFVGVIVFIFSWLMLMPVMLVWALIWGISSRLNSTDAT